MFEEVKVHLSVRDRKEYGFFWYGIVDRTEIRITIDDGIDRHEKLNNSWVEPWANYVYLEQNRNLHRELEMEPEVKSKIVTTSGIDTMIGRYMEELIHRRRSWSWGQKLVHSCTSAASSVHSYVFYYFVLLTRMDDNTRCSAD
ncbi:hypothetical protein EVAR_30988_1 [Eumeta japonica]|uniref:Uncharacterized protein n=1 Tax=Eumeta variegata TaxID=151549 RepID=A0A4C1W6F3_EUMVA|nr:hypothetical protein EVAR_30988_1 [Eumeta japonica]